MHFHCLLHHCTALGLITLNLFSAVYFNLVLCSVVVFWLHVAQTGKKSFNFFLVGVCRWKIRKRKRKGWSYEIPVVWMMRSENFTRKSDWQGFEVILCVLFLSSSSLDQNKVATRCEEYVFRANQIDTCIWTARAKKVAAFMNEAPMKYAFKTMKRKTAHNLKLLRAGHNSWHIFSLDS